MVAVALNLSVSSLVSMSALFCSFFFANMFVNFFLSENNFWQRIEWWKACVNEVNARYYLVASIDCSA